MKIIKQAFYRISQNYVQRRTFRALSELSDKQLKDIGYERDNLWASISKI